MKKVWIIILIIVLISMVSFLCNVLMLAIMNGGNFTNMSFIKYFGEIEKTDENIRKEEKVSLEEIQNLKINFTSADINLIITDSNELKVVQYSNKELSDKELFSINKTSSEVEIAEGNLGVKFSFNLFNSCRVAYDIYIPQDYSEDISIKIVSGDTKVSGELKLKNVEISTTSGDIDILSNLKVRDMKVKTVSGDITMGNIESDNLVIETTSGDIKVESATNNINTKSVSGDIEFKSINGNLNAKTTSGNIDLNNYNIMGETEISSISGEIDIYITETSNCKIETKTTSGHVRLPNGNNTIGIEPYHNLKVKTTSGNIIINNHK